MHPKKAVLLFCDSARDVRPLGIDLLSVYDTYAAEFIIVFLPFFERLRIVINLCAPTFGPIHRFACTERFFACRAINFKIVYHAAGGFFPLQFDFFAGNLDRRGLDRGRFDLCDHLFVCCTVHTFQLFGLLPGRPVLGKAHDDLITALDRPLCDAAAYLPQRQPR